MTLQIQDLSRILFLDIETIPQWNEYEQLTNRQQELWEKKITQTHWFKSEYPDVTTKHLAQSYLKRAGIYAEFGKIVCISAGYFELKDDHIGSFRLKSFYDTDERALLKQFIPILTDHYYQPQKHYLCGHNIKEFDIPFLCRRLIINNIKLPHMINVGGQKPWQTKQFIDTLEQWKFGDYKHYTSLDLIAESLGIPTPKGEMDGSQVHQVYLQPKGLEKIAHYCENDVSTTAQIFLALQQFAPLEKDKIVSLTLKDDCV